MIGTFGKRVFVVSEQYVHTFRDLKRDVTYRYSVHEVINSKPIVEHIGVGLESGSLTIQLHESLGNNVQAEMDSWLDICKKGEVNTLILGGKVVGSKWTVTAVSVAYNTITASGVLTAATLDISLQEYN